MGNRKGNVSYILRRDPVLARADARVFFMDVANGLGYLEVCGITHMGVKPAQVPVNTDETAGSMVCRSLWTLFYCRGEGRCQPK
jgi:hypothetical protein